MKELKENMGEFLFNLVQRKTFYHSKSRVNRRKTDNFHCIKKNFFNFYIKRNTKKTKSKDNSETGEKYL